MKKILERELGKGNVSDNELDLLAYSYDAGQEKDDKPQLVIWPKTREEAHKVIRECNRTNTPLVLRGSGTNLRGMTLAANAVVLCTNKLDKIKQLNKKEKTVTVEAGIKLSKLAEFLKEHGHTFPIKPFAHEERTIGGMAATNPYGLRSYKLGRMKNWIENLAGFDGTGKYYEKMNPSEFAGLEGNVFFITEATLKIMEPVIGGSVDFLEYEELVDMMKKVEEAKKLGNIYTIQFLDRKTSVLMGMKPNHHLLIEYTDNTGKHTNIEEIAKYWKKREAADSIHSAKGYRYREDATILPEKIYDFIEWCEENDLPTFGDAAGGVFQVMLKPENLEVREELYSFVRKINGKPLGLFGYGRQKRQHLNPVFKKVLMALKEKHDYDDILNRGSLIEYR